jgi:hypothetical protein
MGGGAVRFVLSRFGGVAGIPGRPVTVDTSRLPRERAIRLEDLVIRSNFYDLPAELGSGQNNPDAFGYELSVTDDAGQSHQVAFDAAALSGPLGELVAALREAARSG